MNETSNAERTFLLRPDTLYNDENLRINNIISSVNEVLERHNSTQWNTMMVAQRHVAAASIVILVHEKMAAPIALWKDRCEERSISVVQLAAIAM